MSSEALPSLFSELVSSKCDGDRERTKSRFENQCKILDAKVSHLLKTKGQDVSDVLEYTSRAIEMVSNSKAKCRLLRHRLVTCKETLQCKRDDLRRLWLESLTHKHTHLLLAEIEAIRKTPDLVNEHLLAKRYELATRVLVSSIELLEGKLVDIEALKELKLELHRLLDKLYAIFLEELIQELYMSTFHSVYQGDDDGSIKEVTYEKIFNYKPLKDGSRSINFNVSYVTVLLECMVMLGKINETMDILKEECEGELRKIITKLSKLMHDLVQASTDTAILDLPESQGQRFLLDLLETTIGHFRQILINNKKFMDILMKIMTSAEKEDSSIETVDLYSNMQTTLEYLISSYMEIPALPALSRQCSSVISESQCGSDLTAYFESKPHSEERCQMLFKFHYSSQGMVGIRKKANYEHFHGNSYWETNDKLNSQKLPLVCKPCLKNITVMFIPIKNFVNEIENALQGKTEIHCPLHLFILDCANNFLDQINAEVNRILKDASQNLQSWKVSTVSDDSPQKVIGSEKQILSSTLILREKLTELHALLWKLPAYSDHFLHLIYYIVYYYKDLVHKGFKNLFIEELKPKDAEKDNVSGDSETLGKKVVEEKHILSVSWAKDQDIRRLLKSFSNWKMLEMTESGEAIDSPEDIRMRNKQESELLIRNLHSGEHSTWEIIEDTSILFNIAVLQESLQWFSSQLLSLAKDFKPLGDIKFSTKFSSNALAGLNKLVKEYEDFSDVCLLALHLEVRAHCFRHLMEFETVDIDICAKNLADDLNRIEEALVPALTPKELKYIFEGLGELVASILIHNISNCSQVITRASFGKRVQRAVFVIHCCLANITMTREVSLYRVRHFVRSLYLSHDEVVNEAMEEGPRFGEQEYAAVFKILLRGKENEAQIVDDCMKKVRKILNRAVVSV